MQKLNVTALGLAMGILWGVGVALMALSAAWWGYGTAWVELLGSVYKGVAATGTGVFMGLLWGFADGFVCGALLAWLYNKLA